MSIWTGDQALTAKAARRRALVSSPRAGRSDMPVGGVEQRTVRGVAAVMRHRADLGRAETPDHSSGAFAAKCAERVERKKNAAAWWYVRAVSRDATASSAARIMAEAIIRARDVIAARQMMVAAGRRERMESLRRQVA